MARAGKSTLAGIFALIAVTATAAAESRPVESVIELFTSQGCSSCPSADALMREYAQTPGMLVMSLPVDYWDYIGWKDTFASPRNTARQRAYAISLGFNQIYTPQVIVNGSAHAVGSDRNQVDAAIAHTRAVFRERRIPVKFTSEGETMIVEAGEAPAGVTIGQSTIWLAVIRKSADVAIKKGENSGRTLTYTNVVHDMTPVGVWDGKPARVTIANPSLIQPDIEDAAVILQEGDLGPITGAAWLDK